MLGLTQADLENERRLTAYLRAQVSHAVRPREQGREEGRRDGDEGSGLVGVENAVLKRRVQRLEAELEASRVEVEAQHTVRRQQGEVIKEVQQHLQALARTREDGEREEGEVSGDAVGEVAALELELLRERLVRERTQHWQRERSLYVAALLWLCAFFTVTVLALAVV